MPTDVHFKSKPTRAAIVVDTLLVLARRCLIVVAVSLATLLFVRLQIVSWQFGEVDQGAPPELQLMMTAP